MATDVNLNKLDDSVFDNLPDDRLPVDAISMDESKHVARSHGYAYCLEYTATPAGADDEFLHIENDSTTDQVVITSLELTDAGAETITLSKCTGTAGGTTAEVDPVNLLIGSTNADSVTVNAGNDITGLTPDTDHDMTYLTVADTRIDLVPPGMVIVVPPSVAICLSAGTGTTAINGRLAYYIAKHPSA